MTHQVLVVAEAEEDIFDIYRYVLRADTVFWMGDGPCRRSWSVASCDSIQQVHYIG